MELKPEDSFGSSNQTIWLAMIRLRETHPPIDLVNIEADCLGKQAA